MAQRRRVGMIERRTADYVGQLRRDEALADGPGEALAQLALELARTLDAGAGLATAAISRELRATLTDLAPKGGDDDDDADPFDQWEQQLGLPSEVRHTED